MSVFPSVQVNGQPQLVRDDNDVRNVFTQHAGFSINTQVEELTVEAIDAELDYTNKNDHYILRCYVYFEPLEAVNMGSVQDENITVPGWERSSQMVGDGQLCIIYEKAVK